MNPSENTLNLDQFNVSGEYELIELVINDLTNELEFGDDMSRRC